MHGRKVWRACALVLALIGGESNARAQSRAAATPVPSVSGPIKTTETSRPLGAADHTQTPMSLAGRGYVEEEYFVSGKANTYDWRPDGSVAVRTSDRPYTTRILVRRPTEATAFSGDLFVEIGNPARGYDHPFLWSLSHDRFMAHGDAYVMVTAYAKGLAALKLFDPRRYSQLTFPVRIETCGAPTTEPDDGVQWDVASQVGALLKSGPSAPLGGLKAAHVFQISLTGGFGPTYANAIHKIARLANGAPVYDGYVIKESGMPGPLNGCSPAFADKDPRRIIHDIDVPVIHVIAQGAVLGGYAGRRNDSDRPGDRYRRYEIAGATHTDKGGFESLPPLEDLKKIQGLIGNTDWPWVDAPCDIRRPLTDFPIEYVMDGVYANLADWVRTGRPPPKADRIQVRDGATPAAAFVEDGLGQALGGVRTPWIEVPDSRYFMNQGPQAKCSDAGYRLPFTWSRMESLYGSRANYEARYLAAVDKAVQDRWLTPEDGLVIKARFRAETAGVRPSDTLQTSAGPVTITPMGHASVMLQLGGRVIHVDPAGPTDFSAAPKADLILITHAHGDHLDPDAVAALRKPGTILIGPAETAKAVALSRVMANGDAFDAPVGGLSVHVEAVPMYNLKRGPAPGQVFHPKGAGNGYVLTLGDKRLYFAGDTEAIPETAQIKGVDVAFIPMNLPYTQTPAEAADMVRLLRPTVVYPYHYRGQDPSAFARLLREEPGIEVRLRDWYPPVSAVAY